MYSSIGTNNTVTSALWVKQPTTAGTEANSISIYCDKNGNFHSYCGVQSNEKNSIVTTVSHDTNYMRFGNGLQICWGSVGVRNRTATFQQPFKDTNYSISLVGDYTQTSSSAPTFQKKVQQIVKFIHLMQQV